MGLERDTLRPYVDKTEFDINYPITYSKNLGIIDNSTNQSISLGLPTISNTNKHGFLSGTGGRNSHNYIGIGRGNGAKVIKPMISSPFTVTGYKKDIYSDLEFKEYLDWNNLKQLLTTLMHSIVTNYMKVLVSQPFEISKVLLQIGSFEVKPDTKVKSKSKAKNGKANSKKIEVLKREFDTDTSDSDWDDYSRSTFFKPVTDDDTVDYSDIGDTTMESPSTLRASHIERFPKTSNDADLYSTTRGKRKRDELSKTSSLLIEPNSLDTYGVITSLISKEGIVGMFKAVNTSFLISTVQYILESWISGFVSGVIGIPDPLLIDFIHSPNVNYSILLSVSSSVISNLLITPLNLIRLKFIVTTSKPSKVKSQSNTKSTNERSFREIIKQLPHKFQFLLLTPMELLFPVFFTNLIKCTTINSPNYLLINYLKINKYNSPIVYNTLLLSFKIIGLSIRLPFESLLNRAQVHYLINSPDAPDIVKVNPDDLCVRFGGYFGYFSTLYYVIIGEKPIDYKLGEGDKSIQIDIVDKSERNKGIEAIFRGWKLSCIQLISSFLLDLSYNNENLSQEKF